jgi:hypothetical protein
MWGALSDKKTGLSFTMYNIFTYYMNIYTQNIYKVSVRTERKPSTVRLCSLYSLGTDPTENTASKNYYFAAHVSVAAIIVYLVVTTQRTT